MGGKKTQQDLFVAFLGHILYNIWEILLWEEITMKLTFEQLAACAKGAVIKKENPGGSIFLRRMTEEQAYIYPAGDKHNVTGTRAAGITMDFYTDSRTVKLFVSGRAPLGRTICPTDLLVNGKLYASHVLWIEKGEGTEGDKPYGPLDYCFCLPEGEKRVTLVLQFAMSADSLHVELDDGASFRPYTHKLTMVAFGDSITQGHSAAHPSRTYLCRLGRMLDAEVYNYAVSGEVFRANKIVGEYPKCDLVTVAYGTNDFGHKAGSRREFEENMPVFFKKLHAVYPETPTFVLLPLWRADGEPHNDIPSLQFVRDAICEEVKQYANITVIDCQDFIPHEPAYFSDLRLHPNDKGMRLYAEAVYEAMKDNI